jgi:hypothetical protein
MLKTNQVFRLTGRNELVGASLVYSCNLQGENCVSISPAPSKVTGRRIVIEKGTEDIARSLPPD